MSDRISRMSWSVHFPIRERSRTPRQIGSWIRICSRKYATVLNCRYRLLPYRASASEVGCNEYKAEWGLATGGNWWKSPINITCIPPNGKNSFPSCSDFLMNDMILSTSVKRVSYSIDISSIIRQVLPKMFFFRRAVVTFDADVTDFSRPIPRPTHECNVVPLICVAATPVAGISADMINPVLQNKEL